MSKHTHSDLFCDECGRWVTGATDLPLRSMRRIAKERGWIVDNNSTPARDLCPQCQ